MRAWLFCSTDALSFLGYSARAFSNVCWDLVDRCGWSCGSCGYEEVYDDSLYAWVGLFSIASQEFVIQARSPPSFTKSISDHTIQVCMVVIQKGSVKALLERDKTGTTGKVICMMYNMIQSFYS